MPDQHRPVPYDTHNDDQQPQDNVPDLEHVRFRVLRTDAARAVGPPDAAQTVSGTRTLTNGQKAHQQTPHGLPRRACAIPPARRGTRGHRIGRVARSTERRGAGGGGTSTRRWDIRAPSHRDTGKASSIRCPLVARKSARDIRSRRCITGGARGMTMMCRDKWAQERRQNFVYQP